MIMAMLYKPPCTWFVVVSHSIMHHHPPMSQSARVQSAFPPLPLQVPDVNVAEVKDLVEDPSVVLVDCRTEEEQRVSIIPSRRTIPQKEVEGHTELYKDKKLVCYCTIGYRCVLPAAVPEWLCTLVCSCCPCCSIAQCDCKSQR